MILQPESGLTVPQYAGLLAAVENPSASVTLEQYTPSFSLHDDTGGAGAAQDNFDAIVCGDVLVRAYWSAADTITIDTLATEDASDQSWANQNLAATSIDGAVPVTLAVSGDTVRVFWYDGTNIRYFESADKGTTWGASTAVGAVSGVSFLAATALTRVHYLTLTSEDNQRLHTYNYNGSWSATNSEIYWPFTPQSFDAIACTQVDDGAAATNDVIVMATDLAPIISQKLLGTELSYVVNQVQGLAVFRYQNLRWSDHVEFDQVDEAPAFPSRFGVRLSGYGEWRFMVYERLDGKSTTYQHTSTAITRSKDGLRWELPYLLTQNLNDPSILLKRGNHLYHLNAKATYRSASCGYNGDAKTTQAMESYIVSLNIEQGDIQQLDLTVGNPQGVLDSTSPFSADAVLQARIDLGYNVSGTILEVQTLLADVEVIGQDRQMPTDHITIQGRDVMGRLISFAADQPNEWESQRIGGDDFEAAGDDTDYSGMRHTATQSGSFKTPAGDNMLALVSSLTEGVAFNTFCSNAKNGVARAGIQFYTTDADEFAGLVFRAYDKSNLMCIKYDVNSDTIKLYDRREDEDSGLDESGVMGWSTGVLNHMMVRFRYNHVWVYSSNDNVAWTEEIAYELQGMESGLAWTWDYFVLRQIPHCSGRMGYIGRGYSDMDEYDSYPAIPPPPPDETDPPGPVYPGQFQIGSNVNGIFYTNSMTGVPVYVDMQNDELLAVGAKQIYSLRILRWADGRESLLAGTYCGVYEYRYLPAPDGHWHKRETLAEMTSRAGAAGFVYHYPCEIICSPTHLGWCWITWRTVGAAPGDSYHVGVSFSEDGFKTTKYNVVVDTKAGNYTTNRTDWVGLALAPHSNDEVLYLIFRRGRQDPFVSGYRQIYKSVNGGETWSLMQSGVVGGTTDLYSGIWVPYVNWDWDDHLVYASWGNGIQRSIDFGVTWTTVLSDGLNYWDLRGPSRKNRLNCVYGRMKEWSPVDGITDFGDAPGATRSVNEYLVLRRTIASELEDVLWTAMNAYYGTWEIHLYDGSLNDKIGNWNTVCNTIPTAIARYSFEGHDP